MTPDDLIWIDQQKPALVKAAEDYVRDSPKVLQVALSQFRNLLAAAQSGHSVPLLVNFLRYQLGRRSNGWSERSSGEKLLDLLDTEVRERVSRGRVVPADDAVTYALQARVAALLLGYIIRELTYRAKLRERNYD